MQTEYDYNNEPEIDEMGKSYKVSEFSFLDEVGYWGEMLLLILLIVGLGIGAVKLIEYFGN